MTDREKLLVGLFTEADDAYDVHGQVTTLELMAILYDLGEDYRCPIRGGRARIPA